MDRLALLAPQATVNIIREYAVVEKRTVVVPERFINVARCKNANCITNHESWPTEFLTRASSPLTVQCRHCERLFRGGQLTMI